MIHISFCFNFSIWWFAGSTSPGDFLNFYQVQDAAWCQQVSPKVGSSTERKSSFEGTHSNEKDEIAGAWLSWSGQTNLAVPWPWMDWKGSKNKEAEPLRSWKSLRTSLWHQKPWIPRDSSKTGVGATVITFSEKGRIRWSIFGSIKYD